ncbi:MAG: rRNA maturation RNAse YbeY [Deltaproteobacteria bacterium]|jgi:probable rRNA maturation factor|nr:rRNA maturation RNAse YbeY [Deltaproteobacteria bacterium]
MNISVKSHTALLWLLPFSLSELTCALKIMLTHLPPSGRPVAGRVRSPRLRPALELALLDDADMAELNISSLHSPGPTNILAFPSAGLGWMALSVETVLREADIYKEEKSFYALRMLAHGLAHLRGYVHGEEMDELSLRAARAAWDYFKNEGLLPCLT